MERRFNNKKIELLAPAGTMETLRSMVKANCDAIYVGGKSFNMRMMRKGYNLSNEELTEAVAMAHDAGKKIYVTVNNLLNDDEINEATEYLHFLHNIKVDAVIIQDLGILQICKEHHLNNFNIHASVMMNVNNIESAKTLKELGISRIILSRQMDLKTAKLLQSEVGIETEYFVHGDLCMVNDANCYYSSVVFGNSSNRGRCFKPCRWPYLLKKDGFLFPTEYPLAVKDMYMYEYIPELIDANITSFKIEGRMRDTEFIVNLVNIYAEAIDRYIDNPLNFDRKKNADLLIENRKRDFTTAFAFSKPGPDFINSRHEGTGKIFSTPKEEPSVTDTLILEVSEYLKQYNGQLPSKRYLSVKVNNYEQAKLCMKLGVNRIYLPCEVLAPDEFITLGQLYHLVTMKNKTEIYLDLPQTMNAWQFDTIEHYLDKNGDLFDGLLVSNIGAIKKFADKFPVTADYNLNIYNHEAMEFYKRLGVRAATISIETRYDELARFASMSDTPMELIVHGPLRVMYLDYNLYENTKVLNPATQENNKYVDNSILTLKTDRGEIPVYTDQYQKNHLYTAKELCLLPILEALRFESLSRFRIEGQTYTVNELKKIIQTYQAALEHPSKCKDLFSQLKSVRAGFTFGALSFKSRSE